MQRFIRAAGIGPGWMRLTRCGLRSYNTLSRLHDEDGAMSEKDLNATRQHGGRYWAAWLRRVLCWGSARRALRRRARPNQPPMLRTGCWPPRSCAATRRGGRRAGTAAAGTAIPCRWKSGRRPPSWTSRARASVTHVWFTIASDDQHHLKNLVLRAWWDGESSPSIEAPIGDFFGLGPGRVFHLPVGTAHGRAGEGVEFAISPCLSRAPQRSP